MQITATPHAPIAQLAAGPSVAAATAGEPPAMPGVTHKYVNIDGVRYHYAEAGQGEPLVLLHGFPESHTMWRDLIPELAKHYRVIAPDLRGSGWTDAPPTGYRKTDMADDIAKLMTAVGAPRARVMGHDMGGVVGFMLALRHPKQVERYVAMGIASPWPSAGMLKDAWRFAYQPLLAAPKLGAKLIQQPWFVKTMLLAAAKTDPWSDAELDAIAERWRDPARAAAGSAMYREFLTHELGEAVRGTWGGGRLTAPTLLMLAEHDPVIKPDAAGNYRKHADDMRVEVVPGVGHFLPEEAPAYVAARALRFFADPA